MIIFPDADALSGTPPFSAEIVLQGSRPDPTMKDEAGSVWVEVEGQADCLRFFGRHVEGGAPPLVYLEGDCTRRVGDGWATFDGYTGQSPGRLQLWAEQVAVATQRTFVYLARPGVYGSSGDHQHRRRPREVALVDAGLAELKRAFGWRTIDLAGLSGGGHLVAALMARRADIGYAVIASGNVSVRQRNIEQLRVTDVTGFSDFVDPIDLVSEVAKHPPQLVIVLTDPQDRVVSEACQSAYVTALRAAGIAVDHRLLPATEPTRHVLRDAALLAAASICSRWGEPSYFS